MLYGLYQDYNIYLIQIFDTVKENDM